MAVCSKNDEGNAREGLTHPDCLLHIEDFSAFLANWEPKHENIRTISKMLNIGIDSLVFADDNPVERDIVQSQEPSVAVPVFGSNVAKYINIIDKAGYFEAVTLSSDDLQRSSYYAENIEREEHQGTFSNYDDFLLSLEMKAEIKPFSPIYIDRITQLINKTNQFNLTTRRYTQVEVENIANDKNHITLYGRLYDKYGDNGVISIMIGEIRKREIHIDLWLMSCRVLKRGMEDVMFNHFVEMAQINNVQTLFGYYYPTPKNGMVSKLFEQMGFKKIEETDSGNTTWRFDITKDYNCKATIIEVNV